MLIRQEGKWMHNTLSTCHLQIISQPRHKILRIRYAECIWGITNVHTLRKLRHLPVFQIKVSTHLVHLRSFLDQIKAPHCYAKPTFIYLNKCAASAECLMSEMMGAGVWVWYELLFGYYGFGNIHIFCRTFKKIYLS